jgi:hypothetical protein
MDPTTMGMSGAAGQGMLTPQQRMMMAQALAQNGGGQDQFAGIRQALMMRQMQQQPQSQMVSPGTMANGGWSTSVEGGGNPGLLGKLSGMFSGGGY